MTIVETPEAKLLLEGTDGREYDAIDEFPAALRHCPQAERMGPF